MNALGNDATSLLPFPTFLVSTSVPCALILFLPLKSSSCARHPPYPHRLVVVFLPDVSASHI